jgi:hypothetical protein
MPLGVEGGRCNAPRTGVVASRTGFSLESNRDASWAAMLFFCSCTWFLWSDLIFCVWCLDLIFLLLSGQRTIVCQIGKNTKWYHKPFSDLLESIHFKSDLHFPLSPFSSVPHFLCPAPSLPLFLFSIFHHSFLHSFYIYFSRIFVWICLIFLFDHNNPRPAAYLE